MMKVVLIFYPNDMANSRGATFLSHSSAEVAPQTEDVFGEEGAKLFLGLVMQKLMIFCILLCQIC